jgi:hypothetical protein
MKAWKIAALASCVFAGILVPSVIVALNSQNVPRRVVQLPANVVWRDGGSNEVIRADIYDLIDWGATIQVNVQNENRTYGENVGFYRIMNATELESAIGQDLFMVNGTSKIFWFSAANFVDGYFIIFERLGYWYTSHIAFQESLYEMITFNDLIRAVDV